MSYNSHQIRIKNGISYLLLILMVTMVLSRAQCNQTENNPNDWIKKYGKVDTIDEVEELLTENF